MISIYSNFFFKIREIDFYIMLVAPTRMIEINFSYFEKEIRIDGNHNILYEKGKILTLRNLYILMKYKFLFLFVYSGFKSHDKIFSDNNYVVN